MYIIQLFQVVFITCANLAVIIVYVSLGRLREKRSNYLLFSQALSDMYLGALVWYELAFQKWILGAPWRTVRMIYMGMLEYSFVLSIGTLLMGAMERYLLIVRPSIHISVKLLKQGTALIWLLALIPTLCLLGIMRFDIRYADSRAVVRYSYVFDVQVVAVLAAIGALLGKSLTKARLIVERNKSQYSLMETQETNELDTDESAQRRLTRLVKLFIAIMIIFICTYFPIFLGRFLYDVGVLDALNVTQHHVLVTMCHVMYKFSAMINPVLSLTVKRDYLNRWRNFCNRGRNCYKEEENNVNIELLTTNL